RLFVYHAMSEDETSRERFKVMERKLYRVIMLPSMIATIALGIWLLYLNPAWLKMGWMHAKLFLVFILVGYHHVCLVLMKKFARDENTKNHVFYRWFNEIPVVFLIIIVVLAVVKPF
ncbi:MAG TPA: CopD family protein, partial [Marinobacter sp.]|nr:CopD family protein [Marinobacter sp.]